MSQLNQMKLTKKNNKFYRVKNIETGLYLIGSVYEWIHDEYGRTKKKYNLIYNDIGKLYKTERAARVAISVATNSSYSEYNKLTDAGKVLYGDIKHSTFQIVKCSISIRDVK